MKGRCKQRSTVLLLIEAKWPPWAIRFARLSSSLILSFLIALNEGQGGTNFVFSETHMEPRIKQLGKRVLLTHELFKPKPRQFLRFVIFYRYIKGQIGHTFLKNPSEGYEAGHSFTGL